MGSGSPPWLQLRPGQTVTEAEVRSFVKDRLGSVKAPKQVEVWPDLPRSKVGKILKVEVKARLRDRADLPYPQDHLSERGWYVPRSASSFRPGRS